MDNEAVLTILGETDALLTGHFELRSGLHSERFFQCANVLRFPRQAAELCWALADKISDLIDGVAVDTVLAPAMGGIVVGHEVARQLDVRSIFAEKEDEKLVLRRFEIQPGEKIVIAEDVITRGGRVQECIDIIEERSGEIVAIGVLVDRSGGKAQFGYPTTSLLAMEPVTFEPKDCPLCKQGIPLVHPGS